MDHYFIHDATAIETLLLTLAIAFVTTYLFYVLANPQIRPRRNA